MSNEPLRCIGALIIDDEGRVFIQRRSASRALFPNTWDVVGGHVERGETLMETLRREVREETGWSVSVVLAEIGEHAYTGDDGVGRVETDYLVRVDGDLSCPQLEVGKHTEFRWISRDEIAVLDENRSVDGGLMRRIVEDGFDLLARLGGVLPPRSSKSTVVTGKLPSLCSARPGALSVGLWGVVHDGERPFEGAVDAPPEVGERWAGRARLCVAPSGGEDDPMSFHERWAPTALHLALLAAVALAGCGDDDAPSAPAGTSGAGQGGAPGGQGGAPGGQGGALGGQGGAQGGQGGALPDPFGDPACGGAFCLSLGATPANDLHAVVTAGSSVFAVGAGGTVLRRRGGTWMALFVPGAPTLRGVWAASEDELWAVGDFGTVVHVDSAGATLLAPPTAEGLRGIWGAASNDMWVAGDAGTLLHFDGSAWAAVTEIAIDSDDAHPPEGSLYSVWGSGPNDVWAVGGKLGTGSAYHFDGTRWAGIDGFSVEGGLFVVAGSGPDNVWAAGEYAYTYRLHTTPGPAAYVTYDRLSLVHDENEVSAVGGLVVRSPTDALAFSDRRVWRWDGTAWAQTALEAGMPAAPAGDEIWSVGPGGRTFRLDAAGAYADLAPGRLARAHVASDTNALAIGDFDDSGQMQARRWDGTAWAPVALPPGVPRLGGTLDGSSVLVLCTGDDENRTFTATVYADADAVTLPPVQPTDQGTLFDAVVGGASMSDLWLAVDDLLWHFDGVAWTSTLAPGVVPGTGPGSRSVYLNGQVSAFAPNDVWVSGRVSKFDGETSSGQIYVAHYDGIAWVERTPSIALMSDAYILSSSYMTASGPDEAYIGLAFGRSLDDNPPGHQDGFEGYNTMPALYRWAAGAWQQVALPDVVDAFRGTQGLTLAARGGRLYVGMSSTHLGAGKLLVREGEAWSRLEAPVFGVGAIYPTAGALWIENAGFDDSFYYPANGVGDYSPFFPFAGAWVGEWMHAGNDLLRAR